MTLLLNHSKKLFWRKTSVEIGKRRPKMPKTIPRATFLSEIPLANSPPPGIINTNYAKSPHWKRQEDETTKQGAVWKRSKAPPEVETKRDSMPVQGIIALLETKSWTVKAVRAGILVPFNIPRPLLPVKAQWCRPSPTRCP